MRALLSGRTVQTSGGSSGKPCSQLLPSAEPRLTHGTPAPGQPARPPAFHTVSGHAAAAAAADAAAASAASTSDRAGVVPPSDATPKPGMLHQGGSPFDGPVTHKGRADGAASQSLPVTDSAGSMTREGWADGTASQPSLLSAVDGEGGGGGGRTLHAMVAVGEDGGGRGSSRAGMRAGRRNRGRTVGHRGADETAQSAVAASEGGQQGAFHGCRPCAGVGGRETVLPRNLCAWGGLRVERSAFGDRLWRDTRLGEAAGSVGAVHPCVDGGTPDTPRVLDEHVNTIAQL